MKSKSKPKNIGSTKFQEKDIKDVFDIFDINKNGKIDNAELKEALRALGFHITKEETQKLIQSKDFNNEGEINFEIFREIIVSYLTQRNPVTEIKSVFCLFDIDHKGYITFDNLKQISQEMGDPLNDEDLEFMIEKFDKDHDGKINFQEFFDIMDPTHSIH